MTGKTPEMVAIEALADKVGTLHTMAQDAFKRGSERMDEHDDRLRKVENRQAWLLGIGTALGAVVSFASKLPSRVWEFFTS